jgi:quercetin dioxygenase-like cupin family protein
MKNLILAMGLLCSAAAFADEPAKPADAAKPAEAKPAKSKASVAESLTDMKWMEMGPPPGAPAGMTSKAQVAPLWGNPRKGANAAMVKIQGGEKHALHSHTANIRMVMVSGTWITGADEASAKEYGPGSYLFYPAGWKHYSGCKDGAECVFYQDNSGPFDVKMDGAAPAAAPAAK